MGLSTKEIRRSVSSTAEKVTAWSPTGATERLRELVGDAVRLEDGPRLTDSFGRKLAYVYTVEGASIDEALIAEGLAVAWTRDG